MLTRRALMSVAAMLPMSLGGLALAAAQPAAGALDVARLKEGYRLRIQRILAGGVMPYVDIESSCNAGKLDLDDLAKAMDDCQIGLMALSADIGQGAFERGVRYEDLNTRLLQHYPDRFIPVGNGGQGPALMEATEAFEAGEEKAIADGSVLLLGEYEFRHYPSPRQAKRGDLDRDVNVPLDGPIGHWLFALSERTGMAFQIHYEVEDTLLPVIEKMLTQYPRARVIWCHLAQVRYIERAASYSATYVESLIRRFPHLMFDTAFGDATSRYPLSQQLHARIWGDGGGLKPEWLDLIVAHPDRFLSALDLGGDRLNRIHEYDAKHRLFLRCLPGDVQHQVAYRNAWRLLFNEEFA
ncbi:amidohydrolase [Aquabacterium sp.]|uniref:amidohydrolase n=1 Tax=Aquabacterium sp. TaxID=1872578 RepID=UPI0035B02BBA